MAIVILQNRPDPIARQALRAPERRHLVSWNRLRPLLVASQTLPSSSSMTSCRPVCGSRPSPGPRRWTIRWRRGTRWRFPSRARVVGAGRTGRPRWRQGRRRAERERLEGGAVHLYSHRPSPNHRPPPEAGAIDRTSMPGREGNGDGPAARSPDATIRRRRPPTGRHGCRGASSGSPAPRPRRAPNAIRAAAYQPREPLRGAGERSRLVVEHGQHKADAFERRQRPTREAMEPDGRAGPHVAVTILHDGEHRIAREPGPQRRALNREAAAVGPHPPETIAKRADPQHALPVVHEPVSGRLLAVARACLRAQWPEPRRHVRRPDASGRILADAPHVFRETN